MADEPLEEMDEDFDDDVMDSLLGDMSNDASIESGRGAAEESQKRSLPGLDHRFKRFGSKKVILISAALLVLFAVSMAAAWIFFVRGTGFNGPDTRLEISAAEKQAKAPLTRDAEIVFQDIVDLAPFDRIRLKTSSSMRQISMNLSLELSDHRYRKQVVAMEDRIRKMITTQAEQRTWLELRSPEGKLMFKYNLLEQINSLFPAARVRNLYFTYFIMQ